MKNRRNIVEQQNSPQNPNDIWLKDGKFYRSTSEGWTIIDSELEYINKETMIADNPKGGTIGIDKESGEPSIYNDVTKQWSPLGGGVTETTWQELKDKRDAGKLTPGALYRITDYQCTTTQENTKSAGHQFDIVLLALNEDKLAEEGWAMMHENIYDVTFTGDNVTKKCYLYKVDEDDELVYYNIVDVETKIGQYYVSDLIIDEVNKTAETGFAFADLEEENLTYNYFQNSKLEAWKVWYCLDNDKSRFDWADDSINIIQQGTIVVSGTFANIYADHISCVRKPEADRVVDGITYYCFYGTRPGPTINAYVTTLENITSNTPVYEVSDNGVDIYHVELVQDAVVNSYTPEISTINGRGVIYRMIDEWNNDVPYDFKNIQFIRKLANGGFDPDSGEDTWVYTFNTYNTDNENVDSSNVGRCTCHNNYIAPFNISYVFTLPNNVLIISEGSSITIENSKDCTVIGDCVTLKACDNCIVGIYYGTLICCNDFRVYEDDEGIYINNKKVLTES